MTFKLHYLSDNNEKKYLTYDQHTSILTDQDGNDLFPARTFGTDLYPDIPFHDYINHETVTAISPESPGLKHSKPKRLKIQLGLGCNYTCSYCLQATQIGDAIKSSIADANIFLKQLDKWLDGTDLEKIEFWGGEPLLYWHKIKLLAPALREKFPNVKFGMVTNGSLLTKEIIDEMITLGFSMAISHDGPGQSIRGPDPFDDPALDLRNLYVYALEKGMQLGFLSVLSPISYDPLATFEWFFEKINYAAIKHNAPKKNKPFMGFELPPIPYIVPSVSFEGVVHDYNGDDTSSFNEEQLTDITSKVIQTLHSNFGSNIPSFSRKIREMIESIVNRRPSRVLYQNCQMDRDDQMAVDLLGNVMTCQNVGAKGKHRIGNVMLMDKVRLDTSWHWSKRKECVACPLLQLCKGACMYQEGNNFVSTCNSEFAFNMGFFLVAIKLLTGHEIIEVEGEMIRPQYT